MTRRRHGRAPRKRQDRSRLGFPPARKSQSLHFAREVHAGALDAVPICVVDTPEDLAAAFFLHVPAAGVRAADRESSSFATVFECACVHTDRSIPLRRPSLCKFGVTIAANVLLF